MNKNYLAGRRVEYDCMKKWEAKGYSCVRASGSHGMFDVVAFRSDRLVELVQCKRVETQAQAARLVKQFKAKPPLPPSTHFHQVMWVKIKGNPDILTTTV